MRSIAIILLLLSSSVQAQRKYRNPFDEKFNIQDSIELSYPKGDLLKVITDTLPLYYVSDETNAWREMKLVTYYYDTSKNLLQISFRNGTEGDYLFYYENKYLKKAKVIKYRDKINLQYYFTIDDNNNSPEYINRITQSPETIDRYELLKMSKSFFDKFKTLL